MACFPGQPKDSGPLSGELEARIHSEGGNTTDVVGFCSGVY